MRSGNSDTLQCEMVAPRCHHFHICRCPPAPSCGPRYRWFEIPCPPHQSRGFAYAQVFSTLTSDETRWIIPETSWLEMATLRCRHFYFHRHTCGSLCFGEMHSGNSRQTLQCEMVAPRCHHFHFSRRSRAPYFVNFRWVIRCYMLSGLVVAPLAQLVRATDS